MLIVAITIMNIFVAVALPLWSYTIRREREEETIHRGLQYAEAIRVFRQRNGRFPATLDELVKIEPRSIRQLWTEPISEDGAFGLIVEAPPVQPGQPGRPGQPGQPGQPGTPSASPTPPGQPVTVPNQPGRGSFGGLGIGGAGGRNLIKLPRAVKDEDGDTVSMFSTEVPMAIHGVYLDAKGESLRKFFGQDKYEEWTFTVEMLTPPVTAPGRPMPRVTDEWLGKSYPEGLQPMAGVGAGRGAPFGVGGQAPGQPGQPGQQPGQPGAPGIPQGQGPEGEEPSEEPVAEPDTPDEFPEDFPEEEEGAPDENVPEEEPPPDDGSESFPEPDQGDLDDGRS